jgi:hypothetical protein
LLALLLALGGGLILIAVGLGDADGGAGAQGIEVAESNGESSEDAGADRGVVELPQELEGRADVQPVPWPLELDLEFASGPQEEKVSGVPQRGGSANAKLSGTIRGYDARPVPATIEFVAGPNQGRVVQAGADGRFGASNLYGGLSIVSVKGLAIPGSLREVLLRSGQGALLNITYSMPSSVYGEVVDAAGDPVSGALVEMDGQEAYTDEQGAFHFPAMAGGAVLVLVKKSGYASYREKLPIAVSRTIPLGRLRFMLSPGADLQIHVAENLGAQGPAKLYLFPTGPGRINSKRGQRTFPWHLVNPVEVYGGGSVTIEDLPAGQVQMMLFQRGAKSEPRLVQTNLRAGELTRETLHLMSANRLAGRVYLGGKPVEGAIVELEAPDRVRANLAWLRRRRSFMESMVIPHLPAGYQMVRTDKRGEFLFTAWDDVSPLRHLSARVRDGTHQAQELVREGQDWVDLYLAPKRADDGRLLLRLDSRAAELPIEVTIDGNPRPDFILGQDEQLVIEGLAHGTWRLTARWHGEILRRRHSVNLEAGLPVKIDLPVAARGGAGAPANSGG